MAFLAGYVSKRPQYATAEISERIGSFAILAGEEASAYRYGIIAIPNGHPVGAAHHAAKQEPLRAADTCIAVDVHPMDRDHHWETQKPCGDHQVDEVFGEVVAIDGDDPVPAKPSGQVAEDLLHPARSRVSRARQEDIPHLSTGA